MSSYLRFTQEIGDKACPSLTNGMPDPSVPLTPHDYFLVTRVDGHSSLRQLRSISGMNEADFSGSLVKLVAAGVLEIQGVDRLRALDVVLGELHGGNAAPAGNVQPTAASAPQPAPVRSSAPRSTAPPAPQPTPEVFAAVPESAPRKKRRASVQLGLDVIQEGWPIPFDQFMFDPVAMGSGTALNDEQKQVILYFRYHLQRVTYYALIGVDREADRETIKQAYFSLSKAFHPDRWYRKDTGVFGEYLEEIFKWLNRAYGVLSSPRKRKGYDKLLDRGFVGEWQLEQRGGGGAAVRPAPTAPAAATPGVGNDARRVAQALLLKARHAEAEGRWGEAADFYKRTLAIISTVDLHIRVAECMLKANADAKMIDEHVHLAREMGAEIKPLALVEAEVARRLGDHERARASYARVLELEPNNPVARLGLERLEDGT